MPFEFMQLILHCSNPVNIFQCVMNFPMINQWDKNNKHVEVTWCLMATANIICNISNDLREMIIINTLKIGGIRHGWTFISGNVSLMERKIINDINKNFILGRGMEWFSESRLVVAEEFWWGIEVSYGTLVSRDIVDDKKISSSKIDVELSMKY